MVNNSSVTLSRFCECPPPPPHPPLTGGDHWQVHYGKQHSHTVLLMEPRYSVKSRRVFYRFQVETSVEILHGCCSEVATYFKSYWKHWSQGRTYANMAGRVMEGFYRLQKKGQSNCTGDHEKACNRPPPPKKLTWKVYHFSQLSSSFQNIIPLQQ